MVKNNNEQLASILSYLIIGIVWYVFDNSLRKSKFATFHVKQAINLILFAVILNFIISFIVSIIKLTIISTILNILLIILFVTGIISVLNNKRNEETK